MALHVIRDLNSLPTAMEKQESYCVSTAHAIARCNSINVKTSTPANCVEDTLAACMHCTNVLNASVSELHLWKPWG